MESKVRSIKEIEKDIKETKAEIKKTQKNIKNFDASSPKSELKALNESLANLKTKSNELNKEKTLSKKKIRESALNERNDSKNIFRKFFNRIKTKLKLKKYKKHSTPTKPRSTLITSYYTRVGSRARVASSVNQQTNKLDAGQYVSNQDALKAFAQLPQVSGVGIMWDINDPSKISTTNDVIQSVFDDGHSEYYLPKEFVADALVKSGKSIKFLDKDENRILLEDILSKDIELKSATVDMGPTKPSQSVNFEKLKVTTLEENVDGVSREVVSNIYGVKMLDVLNLANKIGYDALQLNDSYLNTSIIQKVNPNGTFKIEQYPIAIDAVEQEENNITSDQSSQYVETEEHIKAHQQSEPRKTKTEADEVAEILDNLHSTNSGKQQVYPPVADEKHQQSAPERHKTESDIVAEILDSLNKDSSEMGD